MNITEYFEIGLVIIVMLTLCLLRLQHYNKCKRRKISCTQVFELPDDNYQVIILSQQYRVIFDNIADYEYSKVYNFPNGTEFKRWEYPAEFDYIIDSILKFKEQKYIEARKLKFEDEMFVDLSDSFSKWDKEFSTKKITLK